MRRATRVPRLGARADPSRGRGGAGRHDPRDGRARPPAARAEVALLRGDGEEPPADHRRARRRGRARAGARRRRGRAVAEEARSAQGGRKRRRARLDPRVRLLAALAARRRGRRDARNARLPRRARLRAEGRGRPREGGRVRLGRRPARRARGRERDDGAPDRHPAARGRGAQALARRPARRREGPPDPAGARRRLPGPRSPRPTASSARSSRSPSAWASRSSTRRARSAASTCSIRTRRTCGRCATRASRRTRAGSAARTRRPSRATSIRAARRSPSAGSDRLTGPKLLESEAMAHPNTFGARSTLDVGGASREIFRLDALQASHDILRLPYTLRVLLENVLRMEDGVNVTADDVEAVAGWVASAEPSQEISFTPARVLLQDFTGVPAVVDLAAMRNAMHDLGGDPEKINPLLPVELVIDHSVQVDEFASRLAIVRNAELEFERNRERYAFLRWGQGAFDNFKVVPPSTGIVHQVNLEFLARVVDERDGVAFPDTLVGTDSHTTMINGLGVLGWGVGGIEAEAAMLGEAISMLVPQVVGFRLTGALPEGATATDLVLTVTQILRETGVVGKFVEYFGHGLESLPLADRATIGNMSPEYGATCGFFPVDAETLRYLRLTGRRTSGSRSSRRTARRTRSGTTRTSRRRTRRSSSSTSPPSSRRSPGRAGRRTACRCATRSRRSSRRCRPSASTTATRTTRPSPRPSPPAIPLASAAPGTQSQIADAAVAYRPRRRARRADGRRGDVDGETFELDHGSVVIAAITSCTNTSNPAVMVGAGLLAKKAVERGLDAQAVGEVEPRARVEGRHRVLRQGRPDAVSRGARLPHRRLRLHDLHRELRTAARADLAGVAEGDLVACAVLSGNRNFEARIHPEVKANYLASPPLVVAYALAGRMDIDLATEPLGVGSDGEDVFLADIWPSPDEVQETVAGAIGEEMFRVDLRRRVHRRRHLARAARSRRASSSPGTRTRPTSGGRPTSTACRSSRARSTTSPARAASSRSATRSRPTTSRPPARSSPTRRRVATSSSTASSARTSTRTARAAATTR